jgi:hypothetical protein
VPRLGQQLGPERVGQGWGMVIIGIGGIAPYTRNIGLQMPKIAK